MREKDKLVLDTIALNVVAVLSGAMTYFEAGYTGVVFVLDAWLMLWILGLLLDRGV